MEEDCSEPCDTRSSDLDEECFVPWADDASDFEGVVCEVCPERSAELDAELDAEPDAELDAFSEACAELASDAGEVFSEACVKPTGACLFDCALDELDDCRGMFAAYELVDRHATSARVLIRTMVTSGGVLGSAGSCECGSARHGPITNPELV